MSNFNNSSAEPDNTKQVPKDSGDNFIYRTPALFQSLINKIGSFAIKAAVEIREIANKDITIGSVPRISSLALAVDKKPKKKQKNSKSQISQKFVKDSNRLLATADTVFPFTLFPDTVTIDRAKVTIIQRTFFLTSKTITLRIEDILNVSTSVGPIFGSISITTRVISTVDHFDINFFWRKDAIRLKHIIQGYIIAIHRGKDIGNLTNEELIPMLSDLGHD